MEYNVLDAKKMELARVYDYCETCEPYERAMLIERIEELESEIDYLIAQEKFQW